MKQSFITFRTKVLQETKKNITKTIVKYLTIGTILTSAILLKQRANAEKDAFFKSQETNIVAFYIPDEYAFKNFKENCEELKKDYEHNTKKKAHLEIYTLPKTRKVLAGENPPLIEKIMEGWIDRRLQHIYTTNGKIDKIIIGLHSEPQASYLSDIITKDSTIETKLTRSELEKIAEKNSNAKKIFSPDAEAIYYGCSAGRGDSSIAETFAKEYNVQTEAPTSIYFGDIICDKEGHFHLSSKQHPAKKEEKATIYKDKEGNTYFLLDTSEYLIDMTHNKETNLIELYKKGKIKIENEEMYEQADANGDVETKLEALGLEEINEGRIENFMTTRTFEKNKQEYLKK